MCVTHALADLTFCKEVTLRARGKDKYKRTIADVFLPEGMNLNQKLVKQGWWYRKLCTRGYNAGEVEAQVREAKPGLVERLEPDLPENFRKGSRHEHLFFKASGHISKQGTSRPSAA